VPRKGLEPPRSYSLVPETSASTNSATWAFQEREHCIKNISQTSSLLDEIEGWVQGHRDGHGFVSRDDGGSDIYLPPNEMRAVLHKDRVKVRIVRSDRKGRPEGRVVEILERSIQPIIGRLLQESGVWLVAPKISAMGRMF
jgi:ribonuclease R